MQWIIKASVLVILGSIVAAAIRPNWIPEIVEGLIVSPIPPVP